MTKDISPTKKIAVKTLFTALVMLKENDGELSIRELLEKLEERVDFTDWERETLPKTGNIRWISVFHFYSIDCVKAGFLRKNHGVWSLTPEGEKALELGDVGLLDAAQKAYRKWRKENKSIFELGEVELIEEIEESDQLLQAGLEEIEQKANESLKNYIYGKNPYEFQDIVAALLRGMGYYTSFVAARGRDGGVDIIAYQDPLGTKLPRIKVQVKHKPSDKIRVDDIRQLRGLLSAGNDIGLFVTSGEFTSDAKFENRGLSQHIELIDIDRFIELWKEFYEKLPDVDKTMLPLKAIHFLAPEE